MSVRARGIGLFKRYGCGTSRSNASVRQRVRGYSLGGGARRGMAGRRMAEKTGKRGRARRGRGNPMGFRTHGVLVIYQYGDCGISV